MEGSLIASRLYTTTLALPEIPTHLLVGESAQSGVKLTISSEIGANIDSTDPRPPGSCAK